jgi:hypothetical protein
VPPHPDDLPPEIDDAARRFAGCVNSARMLPSGFNGWLAIRLLDGGCDMTVYDNRRDAVRHVTDERWYFFFCMAEAVAGITDEVAARILRFARKANMSGFSKLSDPDAPDGGGDLIMPSPMEYYDRQLRQLPGAHGPQRRRGGGIMR